MDAVAELADACTSLLGDAATAVILHGSLVSRRVSRGSQTWPIDNETRTG